MSSGGAELCDSVKAGLRDFRGLGCMVSGGWKVKLFGGWGSVVAFLGGLVV